MEASFLVVLAGGPLGAWSATLLAGSRLASVLAGGLAVVGPVGGPLLGVEALDGRAGPLPIGPLAWVMRLEAEGPVRICDRVPTSFLPDLGGGRAPGPPPPGRFRHRA
jgi:hypothetical protein